MDYHERRQRPEASIVRSLRDTENGWARGDRRGETDGGGVDHTWTELLSPRNHDGRRYRFEMVGLEVTVEARLTVAVHVLYERGRLALDHDGMTRGSYG